MVCFTRVNRTGLLRYVDHPVQISVLIVAQPLSFDEQCDIMEQQLLSVLALFRSKRAHMDPHWYAAFRDSAKDLFKFVKDHIRDEARDTLPKK